MLAGSSSTPFGTLHHPRGPSRWPGVLALHGSEGAGPRHTAAARRLAEQGYAVLAYACFARPARLEAIDLDRIEDALEWMRGSPFTTGQLALVGVSRGAELAILLASRLRTTDRVAAVAVHAPCSVVRAGYDPNRKRGLRVPAWVSTRRPGGLDPQTRIPVEAYEGPLFVTHGTADEVWPDGYTREIEVTRVAAGRHVEAHYFVGEGHVLSADAYLRRDRLRTAFLAAALLDRP